MIATWRATMAIALIWALLLGGRTPARAQPADPRAFAETGYRVDDDAFWDYFQRRGGVNAFGYPASREFGFLGCTTQFFQRLVMQRCGSGGVGTLNLLDEGLLPYTRMDGSIFPGPDADLQARAPKQSDANYGSAITEFVRANATDSFEGEPVNFGTTFFRSITPELAGTNDPAILGLLDLELWGLPTSPPAYDPTNRNFIYLRFQRGIMHYDKTCGCTRGLLLADYLKSVITGQNLPPDLEQQASDSPLLRSAVNGRPPAGTDYSGAFDGVGPPPAPATSTSAPVAESTNTPPPVNTSTPVPTSTPSPTAIPQSALSRDDLPPGTISKNLAVTEPIGAGGNCSMDVNPLAAPFIEPAQFDGGQGAQGSSTTLVFPALPTICFTSVLAPTSIQMNVNPQNSPGTSVAKESVPPTTLGWTWPVAANGGPAPVGTYTVTAAQQAGGSLSTVTTTISIVKPTTPHVLVLPRSGPPGTTFRIFVAQPAGNAEVSLRLYRCIMEPDPNRPGKQFCNQNGSSTPNHRFATTLGPIKTDAAGQAVFMLHSRATDPKTEFAVLTDDMVSGATAGVFGKGRAWFCTTDDGCKTT